MRPTLNHWSIPIAVILLCIAGVCGVQAGVVDLTNKPSRDWIIFFVTMNLLVYGWVRVYSRLTLVRQVIVLLLFVQVQVWLATLTRVAGFSGDGRPQWAWRWSPSPIEEFEQDRNEQNVEPRSNEQPPPDLRVTTAWDSPGFRGTNRDGRFVSDRVTAPGKMASPRQLWRQKIGTGWSSFAVVGEYCVTQEQRRDHEWTVCYELRTGHEVWGRANPAKFHEVTSGEGPRATPTIHQGRVYTLGATGILECLEGSRGEPLWSKNVLAEAQAENRLFGLAGSPLIVDSNVIVAVGGVNHALLAYDCETGQRRWSGGDSAPSYSSPQLATWEGTRQILNFHSDGLTAHAVADGQPLWSLPWISNPAERNNVCQPVVLPGAGEELGQVLVSSGYGVGIGLLGIRSDRAGRFAVETRWSNRNLKAKFSSIVVHAGHIYGLDDAILTCLDLVTGQRKWKAGHYGYGQLILMDSTLVIQLENGTIAFVATNPHRHQELSRFNALTDRTWNHPVLSGHLLLVRNDREAACYELPH